MSGSAPRCSSPWLGTTQGVFQEVTKQTWDFHSVSLQGTLSLSPSVPATDSHLQQLSLPAPGPAIYGLLLEQISKGLMLISHLPSPFPFSFSLALVCSEHDLQARKQIEGHPDWSFIVGKTCKMRDLCSVHKLVWTPYAEVSGAGGESDSSTPCTPLPGADGCMALVLIALQSSTFPQQQQSPLSSGKVILRLESWVLPGAEHPHCCEVGVL